MRDYTAKTIRITLDLTPEELAVLEGLVRATKTRTKSRLLRQIIRFHAVLFEQKQKGYLIQAIKQGSLLQFPDLDVPYPQEIPLRRR